MRYSISLPKPNTHYLQLSLEIEGVEGGECILQFPVWRPGRYERGDFASNVRIWRAYEGGRELPMKKVRKGRWLVEGIEHGKLRIEYDYYANTLNAGATYASENLWMLNPVNFLMYVPGREEDVCTLQIELPKDLKMASSMQKEGNSFVTRTFHEMVDSPVLAARDLECLEYKVDKSRFYIWLEGKNSLDKKQLIEDFQSFSRHQIKSFGSLPVKEFHFLVMLHPERKYHGVEHTRSTVIWIGPSFEMHTEDYYDDLLGICSHELYHCWNVKTIRPKEMLPYDYSEEMYFRTGYVAEGVTTYMGDMHLIQSGVFDWDRFKVTQEKNLYRHLLNEARHFRSVAESSLELWLDGYGASGAPGRISSIYAEGALFSLMLDLSIILESKGQSNLSSLMKAMYTSRRILKKGYSEESFLELCVKFGGDRAKFLIDKYIYSSSDCVDDLSDLFNHFGVELKERPSDNLAMNYYGFRALLKPSGMMITHIAMESPAESAGLEIGMKIEKVNSEFVEDSLTSLLSKNEGEQTLVVRGQEGKKEVRISPVQDDYFIHLDLIRKDDISEQELINFNYWTQGII